MKLLVLALLLLPLVCAAEDITGQWSGMLGNEPALLILKQDGSNVSGTVGGNSGDRHPIAEGKIEGNKVSLEMREGNRNMHFELTVNGDELSGDVSAISPAKGTLRSAKLVTRRVKDAK